jgi:WD40 repeat protein
MKNDEFISSTNSDNLIEETKDEHLLSKECGKSIKTFKQHSECVNCIQVDENSNKLISVSNDETIKIWNLETGQCLMTLNDHQDWISSILITSNNKFISGSLDNTIKIWDLNSYECLTTLTNQTYVQSLCLISCEEIACGCKDGSINIWKLSNSIKINSFKAHDDLISYLLLVDSNKLISCSGKNDKRIKIWNLATFECVKTLEGHSNYINYLELTSYRDLLSCSDDKTVKLWKIETGQILKLIQFNHPVNCVKTLNEDLIATALDNGEIEIYDLKKNEKIKTIKEHSTAVFRLNLLSNGHLLSSDVSGQIKLLKIFDK